MRPSCKNRLNWPEFTWVINHLIIKDDSNCCSIVGCALYDLINLYALMARYAEDIGKLFVQKLVHIRSRLDCHGAVNYHKPYIEGIESSFVHLTEFKMLTEQDVKSLMQHSSLKSCALDPMPSTLFSRCDVLLPVLTRLINMSLKSGQFPVA